ncbi:M24 family metallopeptidase [Poseidonocella sp. HB161398]|uniref:M24 family metallopeptidase n=1 Tax=Poseidonocella sp. HB161398 TaxID=2320855 RepID=UPI00351272F5
MAVIPSICAALTGRTWLEDIRSRDAPDPRDDGIGLLAETLSGMVPERGRFGLSMGAETQLRMPPGDFAALRARLDPRRFEDATACLQRVREIKSEAEIARLRTACAIAGRAFVRVPGFALPGRPLDAVFSDFQIALLEEGADWASCVAGGAAPDGYGDVISPAGPDPLAPGDILMLDTCAVKDGYFGDFDRNLAIGPASETARRALAALWEATEETMAALSPGLRACDLHAMLAEGIRRRGQGPRASGWATGWGSR